MPPPLSVFIIAKNEADRIGATIRAARNLTDDLVVVDSGSTDGTQGVAEELGARVLFHAWPGYGEQKRFAEEQCRHVWMLNLDADEVVPDSLADEIAALFTAGEPARAAYRIGISEIFPGETRPHRFAHTIHPVRLYRRDRGRYSRSPVHDRVDLDPGVRPGRLKACLHHFSVRSLGDELDKLNRYTEQQAQDLEDRGVRIPVWRLYVEMPGNFLKAYLLRRHFLRGAYGFLTAMNYAISRHLRLAKHYERRRLARLVSKTEEQARPSGETVSR